LGEAPQLLVQTGRENEIIDSPRPISFHPLRVAAIGGYGAAGIAFMVTASSPTATVAFQFGGSYRPFSQVGFDARFGIRPAPALAKLALISPSSAIIVGPFRRAVPASAMRMGTGFASPGRAASIASFRSGHRDNPSSTHGRTVSGKLTILRQMTDYREYGAFLQGIWRCSW
jgi:hypothetical protein